MRVADLASDVRRPTSDRLNIGIAGAGLVGRLLAWQLLRRGEKVTLFDSDRRDGERSAAHAAAAMLAPLSESVTHDAAMATWGGDAVPQWRELLALLAEHAATPVALNDGGSVVVAHELDSANLQHFRQQLRTRVPMLEGAVVDVDRTRLRELEPALAGQFQQGLWLRPEGCLDNRALLAALAEAVDRLGGQWHAECPVTAVSAGRIVSGRGEQGFDLAIDARGFGARAQWSGLRGVRGEILWVRAPEVELSRPVRLMHPRYQLYIAPRADSVYVVGATEIESESEAPVTVRSALELLSALYSVHRGFAEAQILHAYARCRPALADNMPRILRDDGLLRVNGLYRHGYLLGPAAVQAALAAIDGDTDHPWVESGNIESGDDRSQCEQRSQTG